jgi:hypothetical protein
MTESGDLPSPDPEVAKAAEVAQEALQTGAVSESASLPEDLRFLVEKNQAQEIELKRKFADQEHELRQSYARRILFILGAQFLLADVVFIVFAWAGRNWDLSTAVIDVWLAATVVQVVGIVLVVTSNLFPDRDGKPIWL